jgi:hypothetical protein
LIDAASSRVHGKVRRLLEKTSPWPTTCCAMSRMGIPAKLRQSLALQ